MSQLSILAVQNAPLLRAIKTNPLAQKADLATATGKDRSNLNRSIAALVEAGLVVESDSGSRNLTDDGEAQLAAVDRAEGKPGLPGGDRWPQQVGDIRLLNHAQIFPDHANARVDWDSDEAREELDALRADIVQYGLLQNLVVRADDFGDTLKVLNDAGETMPVFTLVGGERRWRAIGLAIAEDDWPRDRPIPCRVVELDTLGQRLAALSENLQRRNLNPLEKAKAFDGLAKAFAEQGIEDDKINREIADRVGVTIEHVQQHRSFLKLDEADQQRLTLPKDDPRRMSVREARQKASNKEASKPLDLTPAERLLFAELTHRARSIASYSFNDFEVGPDAAYDPTLALLIEKTIVSDVHRVGYGELTGRFALRLRWDGHPERYFAWFDKGKGKALDVGLEEEQAASGQTRAEGATYVTPWLTGPFELDEQCKGMVAEKDARDAENAERARLSQEEREALAKKYADARQKHLQLLNAAADAPPAEVGEATIEAAEVIDAPLPWRLNPDGMVVAANGKAVQRFGNYYGSPGDNDMTVAQIVVVAVNSAAGLPTPPVEFKGQAVEGMDEEEFLDVMAQNLESRAEADDEAEFEVYQGQASEILATFLEDNGVAYGEDGFDWTDEGAVALIDGHMSDAGGEPAQGEADRAAA